MEKGRKKQTFKSWLDKQVQRSDGIGDLAKDIRTDGHGSRFESYPAITQHILRAHHPCDETREALRLAYREYRCKA